MGLEPSPEIYVERLVEVFREVRRILRDDGVLFLNLGDSFWGSGGDSYKVGHDGIRVANDASLGNRPLGLIPGSRAVSGTSRSALTGIDTRPLGISPDQSLVTGKHPYLKNKDLIGIPWMVAFALQRDGWWLRADNIISKSNPMPESVLDRTTRSHEYFFHLTKSAKYYYDSHAIMERQETPMEGAGNQAFGAKGGKAEQVYGAKVSGDNWNPTGRRNKRSVMRVSTKPFKEAHFATYNPTWISPWILSGTSERGACAECLAPYKRVIKHESHYDKREPAHAPLSADSKVDSSGWEPPTVTEMGWEPTCDHKDAPIAPCVIFDPFMGSGTTGMVAAMYGRSYIGTELNPVYAEMAQRRIYDERVQINLRLD